MIEEWLNFAGNVHLAFLQLDFYADEVVVYCEFEQKKKKRNKAKKKKQKKKKPARFEKIQIFNWHRSKLDRKMGI